MTYEKPQLNPTPLSPDVEVTLNPAYDAPEVNNRPGQPQLMVVSTELDYTQPLVTYLLKRNYNVSSRVVDEDELFTANLPHSDLQIISVPKHFVCGADVSSLATTKSERRKLAIVAQADAEARRYFHLHGVAGILIRPFVMAELVATIEQCLFDRRSVSLREEEDQVLTLLKLTIEEFDGVIGPSIDPVEEGGHSYPVVERVFGRYRGSREILEKIADEGLLSRKLVNRVRVCPICFHSQWNYREVCPACHSVDIQQHEVIHHFACGHVNTLDAFRQGSQLICPKCNQTLRHIGLDYEKPHNHFVCNDCGAMSTEPRVEAQCLECGSLMDPGKTREWLIYEYHITEYAEQALEEDRLSGAVLSKMIQNTHTGMYTKPFFIHEIERELLRVKRYQNKFTLMMVMMVGFGEVIAKSPGQATEYATAIFTTISSDLRPLDLTCVWHREVIAILLPNTDQEGAVSVAERIQERVSQLHYLYEIRKPEVIISIRTDQDAQEAEELLEQALDELPLENE